MGLLIFQISSIYVMIFHRSGLIPGVCLVVVSAYGAFLQIVNKKGRFQRAYLQKCTKHVRTRGMITCDGKSDRRRDGVNIIALCYLSLC